MTNQKIIDELLKHQGKLCNISCDLRNYFISGSDIYTEEELMHYGGEGIIKNASEVVVDTLLGIKLKIVYVDVEWGASWPVVSQGFSIKEIDG